mgnify:CR=1 FL=1
MHLIRGHDKLRLLRAQWSKSNQSVSLVPTMGSLHAGHQELVRRARENSDRVVVSIFVNPLQFGSDADFGEYPRNLVLDQDLLQSMEVDAVYSPSVEGIYPEGLDMVPSIPAGRLGEILEGRSRPGHFSGMLTVVKRLFEQVSPQLAVFGEKDAQQYFLIDRMVADYKMPIKLLEVPTVRDENGLALSSRNTFLSSTGRKVARKITLARELARKAKNPVEARIGARQVLDRNKGVTVDYVEIVDPDSFVPIENENFTGFGRLVVAVVIDGVRLLDTELFEFGH